MNSYDLNDSYHRALTPQHHTRNNVFADTWMSRPPKLLFILRWSFFFLKPLEKLERKKFMSLFSGLSLCGGEEGRVVGRTKNTSVEVDAG